MAVIQQRITQTLQTALAPEFLQVNNESYKHNVPEGAESHFQVVAVSEQFNGKSLVQRHRMINQLLADELAGPVHALSLQLHTPEQWASKGGAVRQSPPCASKR